MQQKISQLSKENLDLEAKCMEMEEYIERVQREEEKERISLNEAHDQEKKDIRMTVAKLKIELDKTLSLKINF